MSLVSQMLKNLNIENIMINNDGKVIASTIEDKKFIEKCIECVESESNMFHFDNKFYSCGKETNERQILYWCQDVSKVYDDLGKDKLTKLYNRVIAQPLIDEYILHSFEINEPFSVVICDIDHFKQINDTYGHIKADEFMSNATSILLNNFRTRDCYNFFENNLRRNNESGKDILCRYGGEEFIIIVKNINLENTLNKVEKIREMIEENGYLTMSFGVYHCNPNEFSINLNKDNVENFRNNIVECADKCLYYSKENGRNQVSYMENYNGEIISNQNKYTK